MPVLTARLFGPPAVTIDGKSVALPYKKAEGLLYYLILRRKVSRSELVGLLWSDVDSSTALKNLRHAIYSIRKEMDCDLFVGGQRSVLELRPDLEIHCDVADFLEDGDLSVCRGEFLQDFSIPRAGSFDEWLTDQRSMLQSLYLKQLLTEEKEAFRAGDLRRAERCGLDYIAADPLEESAVVVLMEVYAAQKKFRKAIGLYHDLCKNLSAEFSISPLKETTALYYRIVNEWNTSTYKIEEQSHHLLVGKELVLRRLLALCNGQAEDRKFSCALIEGEAGVGKTYILDHILNHYDFSDWLVCRGSCYPSEANAAYSVWNGIMLTLVSEMESRHLTVPENCRKTAAGLFPCFALDAEQDYVAPNGDFSHQASSQAAQESTLLILSLVAKRVPVLLVFEDIHWMDKPSAEMLGLFLRRLRNLNVTVLCTARDIVPPHVQELIDNAQRDKILERFPLRQFDREETGQFLNYYLGEEQAARQADQIYQNTGGNALLLTQLVSAMQEPGGSMDLPQDPEALISYRLSNLSSDQRQVLDLISVFTEWVSIDALTSILTKGTLELMYLCDQLKQRALISESTRDSELCYALVHDRIRSILVRQQSESTRRILHLRVAQYMETKHAGQIPASLYDRLIYHYTAGGDRFKVFQYHVLSLDAFTGLCYELLPTLNTDSGVTVPNEEGLLDYFQSLEKELAALRRSGADGGELDRLELCLLHAKSRYCIHNGYYDEGLGTLDRMIARCEAVDNREMLVKAHMQIVYYGIQTYDTDAMEAHLTIVGRLLAGEGITPDRGVYLRLSGATRLLQGKYEEARSLLWEAIRTFQALDPGVDGQYTINIAGVYYYIAETYRLECDYEEACRYYDQAILYNRSRDYYPGVAVLYTNYGVTVYQMGDRVTARPLFEHAERIYRDSHEYSGYPIMLAYLALYDTEDGNYASAARRLREAMEVSQRLASPWWMGITVYQMWKVRQLLEQRGLEVPELTELWPEDPAEHCRWALSYLHRLQPRIESRELEETLEKLG